MANVGDTGNGTTITLTTQTSMNSYKVESIQIGETTLDMLDVSHLGTSGDQERIASDLRKHGDWTINVIHNPAATAVTITGAVDTATITFPVYSTQTTTTGATVAASGVITSVKLPDLANGQVMKSVYKFSPDGDTGPTYTRGS